MAKDITPDGYMPRVVDEQIDQYLKVFGAVNRIARSVAQCLVCRCGETNQSNLYLFGQQGITTNAKRRCR